MRASEPGSEVEYEVERGEDLILWVLMTALPSSNS